MNNLNMAYSPISRPGRGLILPGKTEVLEQNIDEEGEDVIKDTLALLDRGGNEIKLGDQHVDEISRLGSTGNSKNIFTRWKNGDETKLKSKETEEDTGEDKNEKWCTFLEDLYNKFSVYDVQKDRQRYNVADLEDWGQSDKPQGISVTTKTFGKFLKKIENYRVSEYENIKNLTTTSLQIDELNQVLSLTLNHRQTVRCSESFVIVKGSFISLKETMKNIMGNLDTNNSCKNFKALFESRKYRLIQFLALNTVFIDTDLSFIGKGISVAIIAPNWEVVGYRSIDISGADGAPLADTKAKNGAYLGDRGVSGAPGNPGVSGESFFGLGATFVGGSNLKINSNGGKGSRGQDGGDGSRGVSGHDAPIPAENDPDCVNERFREYKCLKVRERVSLGSVETHYKIYGSPGGRGGNGGSGGKGGKGGDPGKISIVGLNRPSGITKLASKGREGENGHGGTGGNGGRDGNLTLAQFTRFWKLWGSITKWYRYGWDESYDTGPRGSDGANGGNSAGIKDQVPANGIGRLPDLINGYKMYLRENANNRFNKSPLLQFLEQLNNNNDVRKLYDTLGLIEEFQGLEEQFPKLSKQIDFSSFYSSLLDRISELAKTQKDGPNWNEKKKVLNFLYTAILGKIYNLSKNSESNLIIDIRGYLNVVKENIKTLKDLQATNNKVNVINKYKENYKKGVDKKIEEAKSFIRKQISPELENINSEIDNQVNSLIEETITLRKQAEKDWSKLAEKKKELEKALGLKGVFSFFQIIGGIVSFLGPIGAITGTVIEVTSTVSESLALNKQQKTLNLPSDVVSAIKSVGDQIKTMRNRKVAYLNKLLDNVSEEIKKNPEKLRDMTGKIEDIRNKLKKASENKLDFKQFKVLEGELNQELKRKGDDLKSQVGDKKSIDALKVITKITQIVQFGSLLVNVYDKTKGDKEKMDALTEAMEKVEDKIRKLREYEENIYDTISPMLREMEDNLKDISDKLESKSQVALDVTKWQVQSTLKDMRLQMEGLTEGFEVKEDLSRSIEKLDEVMVILINAYDRIQSYQDQQNLANYIADISSVAANGIKIKDQQLVNAVSHLEFVIRANIVLEQYKSALDAFKQWVFPFADHYIEKPMLPSQLELDKNIQNLVQNATREIEIIKQKLDLYNTSVKNGDQYLECEEFSSRYVSSKPFFIWKNEKYGSLISSLLSGKEVVLKADVRESPPYRDAIKFSEIDFHLKSKNETVQSLVTDILKGFDIRATHMGNSYYRYADKISLITSDSVTISYSNEKNNDGIPIRSNNVYNKLKSGDLLLSPYTLWEVRMVNQTNKYTFQDLESYKNVINVELSGLGSYVNTNVFGPFIIAHNNASLHTFRSQQAGVNQCRRSKNRVVRSAEEILVEDHMTNGASSGMSSPINFLGHFLKAYFIPNAVISINQFFAGEKISSRNCDDCSDLLYESTDTKKIPNAATNPTITDTDKLDTTTENYSKQERIVPKSDSIFISNFDGNNSCFEPSLLSDQKDKSNNLSTYVPDLNCSLLLADLVTRTISGKRYQSPIDESLLSPSDVISGKISDGVVRSESDVKEMLQRLMSEKEEKPRSWFSKFNGYAKSTFQFFGLVGSDDTDEYVQNVRHLYLLKKRS